LSSASTVRPSSSPDDLEIAQAGEGDAVNVAHLALFGLDIPEPVTSRRSMLMPPPGKQHGQHEDG